MEKIISSIVEGYNHSKEDFTQTARDDIIFLPPGEPILKGRQGKILL